MDVKKGKQRRTEKHPKELHTTSDGCLILRMLKREARLTSFFLMFFLAISRHYQINIQHRRGEIYKYIYIQKYDVIELLDLSFYILVPMWPQVRNLPRWGWWKKKLSFCASGLSPFDWLIPPFAHGDIAFNYGDIWDFIAIQFIIPQ